MGVKKGTDNFKGWRKERSDNTLSRVKRAVSEAGRHRLIFADEKKMASWVASRVGKHRTTIIRSPIYMAEIDEYFKKQRGVGSIEVDEDTDKDLMLSKVRALELENARQQREIERLKGYIEKHNVPEVEMLEDLREGGAGDLETNLADVCYTLMLIHERVRNIIEIDRSSREVRDLTQRGGKKIVANGERVNALFDWLDQSDL